MNGIVATFDPVAFPDTWADLNKDFLVPLTVWTSEGSASLPIPARFRRISATAQPVCPNGGPQVAPPQAAPPQAAPPQTAGPQAARPQTPGPQTAGKP